VHIVGVAKALTLNMENATLTELQVAKACAPTFPAFNRMLVIEYLYKGMSPSEVTRFHGASPRSIRRWVASFNEFGIDGLVDKGKSGRPRRIPIERFQGDYLPLLTDPTNQEQWSAVRFHGHLRQECKETLCYSTLVNYLHEAKMALVKGRPTSDKQDPDKRKCFLDSLEKVHATVAGDVWFADEVGFEGDPRPMRIWVKKGSKPYIKRSTEHLRFNAVGAVNPASGECIALVVPHNDGKVFQLFLDEVNKTTNGKAITMVLDNASWHKVQLNWHNITPLYLPPYSPDLNPIENIWKLLKGRFFNNWYALTIEQLEERIYTALQWLLGNPAQVKSTASMDYLLR
jgi:transposase